jgi:hypothetical protein
MPRIGSPSSIRRNTCLAPSDLLGAEIALSAGPAAMSFLTRFAVIGLFVAMASAAHAQLPQPRLYSVQPPGVQQGQTIEVSLAGDDLEEIKGLLFDHPGLTAVPKMADVNGQPQPVDRFFIVTATADVPVGPHEVRCQGLWGVSNARKFYVGSRPQVVEVEPNNVLDKAMPLTIGTAILGRMDSATDVDLYKFTAKAGQRLVIECDADVLDSRLRSNIEIHDARAKRRLAVVRGDGTVDPVLVFDTPADGEYLLKLNDGAFRGGQEYFYRLDVHQSPHIEFVFPPSGLAGQTSKFSLYGYNLPGSQPVTLPGFKSPVEKLDVDIAVPGDTTTLKLEDRTTSLMSGIDAFSYRLNGQSNAISIGIAQTPVVAEIEPNNEPAKAQLVSVPSEVIGQFAEAQDVDTFTIDAKAGDVLYVEVLGQRLGQTVDPYLTIDRVNVDAKGVETLQRIAAPDDEPTNPLPYQFDVRSDDPVQRLEVPADGKYRLTLRDRFGESRGSARNVYRLSIHAEAPDFRLVALPASPTPGAAWSMAMRKGDTFAMQVIAFRRDGFNGPIDVRALDLPAGVTCAGTTIPDGVSLGLLQFRTTADAPEGWHPFRVEGQAKIDSPALNRAAAAAKTLIPEAEKALPPLQTAVEAAAKKLAPVQEALAKSEEALTGKVDDPVLIKLRDAAKAAVDAATAVEVSAKEALAAAQKKVADLKAAADQAAQASAAANRDVVHPARAGEIAWSGADKVSSVARVRHQFGISILAEAAPFQLNSEPIRMEVVQGRQILVPVKLEKRGGFNDKVALTAAGMKPNSNIDAPNIAIEKDQAEAVWRLLVKDNALPGVHTMWLTSAAPVSYRRNPAKADRVKAEFDAIAAQAKVAVDAVAAATAVKTAAVQKATASSEEFAKTQLVLQAVKKSSVDAKTAADTAVAAQAEADKQSVAAAAALTAAQAAFDAAKSASDANAANEDLKKTMSSAEEMLNKSKEAAQVADTAKAAAAKMAADSAVLSSTTNDALKLTDELVAKLAAADKVLQDAKAAAEADEKARMDASAALEAKRVAAEKASAEQAKASGPNNINFTPPAVPVILVVKPAPVKLAPNVPNSGNIKKGDKIEVKVAVTRQNGFAGPVTLSLPQVPGLAGLAAAEVTVPADQAEGVLIITAAGDAKDGALANLVIQAKADFGGETLVDAPIALTVTP